ncbi:T9SS type A sorting domain-containing protein [Flavobacterium taihuense]|uniref:T9SS type A sorting domain-containing protein n=1 Tax=Flavobacterium taihuense TaxID=2857508 RepID=A0ABS6XRT8_9FLAO|nr:T9SS type A sorting domain-containing protein [Flavobacterium taihuense]MBW4358981.1 T9SS type A sorting domain-containing protein [Flavobacterium taihuense]
MKIKLLILLFLASLITYAQTNLVPNGGFENWTNSTTLSNWTIENNITQNTSFYTEGSKSAQLSIANSITKPKIIAQVPMIAGTTYTVKFNYRYINANYSGDHPIALNISQNGSATTLSSSTFATDNSWNVKETTFTPDQNLSYDLSISLYTFDDTAFNVLIDDVQVYIQGTEQYTTIPDVNFENKLIALGIDSGTVDGKVLTENVNKITSLNVSSSSISDLTGIQDFAALTDLDCSWNLLSSIDLTKNLALVKLDMSTTKLTVVDLSSNINLEKLTLVRVDLVNLDITKNINLTSLIVNPGGVTPGREGTGTLTSLDLSKNSKLKTLDCSDNKIITLDFTSNTLLESLSCGGNKASIIDLSKNTAITNLSVHNSLMLENIDISTNTKIQTLDISYSNLKTLDVSKNTDLKNFKASGNILTSLDLSKNIGLTSFSCEYTKYLNDINLKNGANTLLIANNLKMKSNVNLTCILVDDITYSNTNWLNSKDAEVDFTENQCVTPTYTLIPDANFEESLIIKKIDAFKDGKVLTSRISSIVELNLGDFYTNLNINDMTGIQDFTNLEVLILPNNGQISNLTSLDVSKNLKLKKLDFYRSQITSLDLSKNTALTTLSCNYNQLTSLDVSKNLALNHLECQENQLTTLDLSKNLVLNYLHCSYNQLTTLDVSKNVDLKSLNCNNNRLTELDVSNNTALTTLSCNYNKLTSLDVSKNLTLTEFYCYHNMLTSLNLKNGNNTLITNVNILLSNNQNLKCIQVDDINYSDTNWSSKKDATATFNTDCTPYTMIPDINFEQKLIDIGIDTDGKNGKVKTASINTQIDLDVRGATISDLSGIEDFTALKILVCSDNLLTQLNLSKNTALITLFCEKNQLTNLDVSKNSNLDYLVCHTNQLTSLDVSSNLALTYLSCGLNQFTDLDVSKNTKLTSLYCSNGIITKLNIKNGNNTNITAFIATKNPTLSCIQVDDVNYADSFAAPFYKDATATYSTDCSSLGIEDSVFDKITIYPNPTKRELHVDNVVLEKVTIYDASGKFVKMTTFTSGAKDNTILLTGFPKGIYYVYLESEGANTAKKIIVE